MRLRRIAIAAVIVAIAALVWRAQLFTVSRPGERARALEPRPVAERRDAGLDVVLPAVPVGMRRLHGGDGAVLIVHYWAPWERHGLPQARGLDSLLREPALEGLAGAIVSFDPFPSVARYVARQRLRVPVLLDPGRTLQRSLPCPSIPYTYVLDRAGRIAIAQPGEVDWQSDSTASALRALLDEPRPPARAPLPAATRGS